MVGAAGIPRLQAGEDVKSRSGDVLRFQAYAESALPEMQKVWRDEARRAAADVARLVALREPATVARMEAERGLS